MARRSRDINLPAPYLKRLWLDAPRISDRAAYPFCLPFLSDDFSLDFERAITIIVGENGTGKFRGLDFEAAIDLLLALNVAKSLGDLSPLKSVGLHKLKGDRKGQWAMTVNGRWRICFEFRRGDAFEVEIVDYHKG